MANCGDRTAKPEKHENFCIFGCQVMHSKDMNGIRFKHGGTQIEDLKNRNEKESLIKKEKAHE